MKFRLSAFPLPFSRKQKGEETPPPPPERRAPWRRRAIFLLTPLLVLAGLSLWALTSERGLGLAVALAARVSEGRLTVRGVQGSLSSGHLAIAEIVWRDGEDRIRAEAVQIDWQPARLRNRHLQIERLAIGQLDLDLAPSPEPLQRPETLRPPLSFSVEAFALSALKQKGALLAENIGGRLSGDTGGYRLSGLSAQAFQIHIAADAGIAAEAPFALHARGQVTGRVAERPLALDLAAEGPLEAIRLAATSREGLRGDATATLAPFTPQIFSRLHVRLADLDPAAWAEGAPAANLEVEADLAPVGQSPQEVAGAVQVLNRTPGSLDQQGLPVKSLRARLHLSRVTDTEGRADFPELAIDLPGKGRLVGWGAWANGRLSLALTAESLDAAALHARLKPTQMKGRIEAGISPQDQALKLDLADPRFTLHADLGQRDQRLEIRALRLNAGAASLQAGGHLELAGSQAFALTGDLSHFDPSRFAKLPAARLNAAFEATGEMRPTRGKIRFALKESLLAGQALSGQGEAEIRWPHVRADLQLAAGPNRLAARGAFGRPGDSLKIDIEAPELSPYGLEGGLNATLVLAGTPELPVLEARAHSPRLALAGVGHLQGLDLEAKTGGRPGDPLHLAIRLISAGTPEQPEGIKNFQMRAEGSRRQHRLEASTALGGSGTLKLAAEGGLADQALRWEGQLSTLEFSAADPRQNLRLAAAAPLRLGAEAWAFGPAALSGEGWQGRIGATAGNNRLRAHLEAEGASRTPRPEPNKPVRTLGKLSAQIDAPLIGAWTLQPDAAWQGAAQGELPDLSRFSAWLGDGIGIAGRLAGQISLSGTPARPVISGETRGEALALRLIDQGLRLENGSLDARIDHNRLMIRRLAFDSPLKAPPAPLVLAGGETITQLAAEPGRLEIGGEVRLDQNGGEHAFLDIRLDRLGAAQSASQWVVVSGQGRVDWQSGSLGLNAKLAVDAGYWRLAGQGRPQLSDDVIVKQKDQKPAAPPRTPLALDIETRLGRYFYFEGAGLDARLSGNVRLRAADRGLPQASGSIRTVDGRFDAYGQQLDIQRGILNFTGLLDNPALNVRALRRNLPLEAGVEVTGTVRRPVVRLVSDPEMPDAEKLSWLVLGHGLEQGADASLLVSAAGALLGGESGGIVQQIKRGLGLEELSLRSGQIGDSNRQASSQIAGGNLQSSEGGGGGGQILSLGKRLSSNILLSYEQALGTTESIVKLTVQLNRRLSLVGRAGSDNALDLLYTLSFGGKAAPGKEKAKAEK